MKTNERRKENAKVVWRVEGRVLVLYSVFRELEKSKVEADIDQHEGKSTHERIRAWRRRQQGLSMAVGIDSGTVRTA